MIGQKNSINIPLGLYAIILGILIYYSELSFHSGHPSIIIIIVLLSLSFLLALNTLAVSHFKQVRLGHIVIVPRRIKTYNMVMMFNNITFLLLLIGLFILLPWYIALYMVIGSSLMIGLTDAYATITGMTDVYAIPESSIYSSLSIFVWTINIVVLVIGAIVWAV